MVRDKTALLRIVRKGHLALGLLTMKTNTLAAIGILLAVVTLGSASTEKAVDRPSGISDDQWFPISDRLGLVISANQPALTGYLMLKQKGHWTRLSVVATPTLSTTPPRAHTCGSEMEEKFCFEVSLLSFTQ